ncbi:3-deoxy-D-manno-octulosonic-acid transferase, partial [Acidithiobacillus sp. GGI-221]
DNFKGITQDLLAANAAVQVVDVEALVAQLAAWLTTQGPATEMGDRALAFLQQQRGALRRTLSLLDHLVP